MATGHWGASIAEIEPGSTVAVIGAGPVGLTTMMCARLHEPATIIAIDIDPARLALARERGLADRVIDASGMDLAAVEASVRELSHSRGADSVIEAAGGSNTFEMAWRIARPHGVVVLSAMYEGPQTLPLHQMYGKNLVFKTGGVDACNMGETMRLVQEGHIDTSCLISGRYPLATWERPCAWCRRGTSTRAASSPVVTRSTTSWRPVARSRRMRTVASSWSSPRGRIAR